MPVYQKVRTFRSGFYNNKKVNGVDDRVYSAKDMKKPYSTIFTDGIRPNEDGTLGDGFAVTHLQSMTISIGKGIGMFKGLWFENESPYNITLDAPEVSTRYDMILIRADESDETRDTYFHVRSINHEPTIDDLERNENVKEFLLAYVRVTGQSVEISQANIFDTRMDQLVCGLITGIYQQLDGRTIYAQWQQEFNDWLDVVRDSLVSTATIDRMYFSQYITRVANEDLIPIQIPQYNKELDDLMVIVNGQVFSPNNQYKIIDNTEIQLLIPLPLAGQQIIFIVSKSIDGSEANTILTEHVALQQRVHELEKSGYYQYNCNGHTDNVQISNLVKSFLEQDVNNEDFSEYTIYVNGVFGANAPVSGAGTTESDYRWFDLGVGVHKNRRVTLDFSNCSRLDIYCEHSTYNIIFHGKQLNIKNVSVNAVGTDAYIKMFAIDNDVVINCENSRLWLTGLDFTYIARGGTFTNCRGSVTNRTNNSYCFNVGNANLLRIIGGEYYAYTSSSSGQSGVVYVASGQTDAVVLTYGVNIPQVARSGFYQTHAFNITSGAGKGVFTDTVTPLTITASTTLFARNTINANKPNLM